MREDENIVCRAEIHWVIIIPYIILIAIGTYLGGKYGFLITLILSLFLGFAKKLVAMLTTELYFNNLDKIDHVSVESIIFYPVSNICALKKI